MEFPNETPRWRRYLRFWRRDVQGDIDDELRFHFQARIDELMAQGRSAEGARAQAVAEFGDVDSVRGDLHTIDERMARRERRLELFDAWRQDLIYAWRSIRRTPGVTIIIVATLALGLGANTAMFSFLNSVYLKPPAGVARPEQVRRLWTFVPFSNVPQYWSGFDYVQYAALRDAIGELGTTAIYERSGSVTVGRGAASAKAMMSHASSAYFPLLGARPALGRFFLADEDQLGAGQHVAVVSHAFWSRALGADSTALGKDIVLAGTPYTVIGVADPAFTGVDLSATDVWVPLATLSATPWWTNRNVNGFQVLARLDDGVAAETVDARVTQVMRRAELRLGKDSTARTVTGSIILARGPGKKEQEVQIATRLGGVALIVLLIACANVVNLLLARAVRRRREIAMRLALGMSRGRLTMLVLTESVMLALLAGVAAIVVAQWGGLALRAILLPDIHWTHLPVDWRVLAGAVAATLVAGLAAGAIPAIQSGSTELTEVLKAGAREGFGYRSRVRSALVMAQAAFSVTLLVGAALFVRSLSNVRALDLGFDASRLLYARVTFDTKDAARDSLTPARLTEVAERIAATPGVEGTALTGMRPMYGFSTQAYFPGTDTIAHPKPMGMYWAVTPRYFATAGTRIVAGHDFESAGTGAAPSVIVNTAMANALWPGASPLGRCVRFKSPEGRCNTVVGVVETAHWGALIEEATPQFYLPLGDMPFTGWNRREVVVRARESAMPAVTAQVRAVLRQAFPDGTPVIERMSTVLEPKYRPWRLGATLFSMFGILAALVAAIGVYSSVSYGVSQRTHEFGVRVALGARLGDVVGHVLADGLRTVAVGVAIGVALSLAGGRLVATLLYGISPHDPAAILAVAATLLAVAAIATLVPAWRAARVDPVSALRVE